MVEGPRSGARDVEGQSQRGAIGRPPAISVEDVVAAATSVAEQVGIDGVTMNLVAERLRIFERDVRAKVRGLKRGTPRVLQDGEAPDSLRRLFGIAREIMHDAGADERELTLGFATVYAFMIGPLWFDRASTGPGRQPPIRVGAEHVGFAPLTSLTRAGNL